MARMIKRDDVALVRERARIDEIVGEHVSLRPAGIGSMKGLCPFHDEKTPSFHVRPQLGHWHCFGCDEGGDVISFVMKINAMSFAEAVEYLAGRAGVQLRYEDDGGRSVRSHEEPGTRQRLAEANRVADAFFREQLATPEALAGRKFLADRGFDADAAALFGVGYAPKGWDSLVKHLRGKGFTEKELTASGLASAGNRGPYDRFRGRLIWPIRDVTGAVVGFGARKLHEDDQGPKYLNTPETVLYKKSQVLYGLDLAKKAISTGRQVVIVEGYTDVMAMHLAGITTAVATCGTAFGEDHVRVVRRLLGDIGDASTGVAFSSRVTRGGEVIFTFDGDSAGQKAALRAFDEDQRFAAQTFVAVEPSGMDPCDLRMARGDAALVALLDAKEPLFAFAIRTALASVNLDTAEGRVAGLRAAAPVVARIRDRALRAEYSRSLAGWLGMPEGDVRRAVGSSERGGRDDGGPEAPAGGWRGRGRGGIDPVALLERQALEVALQLPAIAVESGFDALADGTFLVPTHQAVHEAIRAAGGAEAAVVGGAGWLVQLQADSPEQLVQVISALSAAPLPASTEAEVRNYGSGIMVSLLRMVITRRIADVKGRLQRAPEGSDEARDLFAQVVELESRKRALGA